MNNKITVAVSAPVDTYSGYGARSRDVVKALIAHENYDIQILSQRWGNTRTGYLSDHSEDQIENLIVPNLNQQPDVWIQITVPNEFQKVGLYNIGVTAGIETDICAGGWIEGCNKMDLVLTSSEHSKNVFQISKFDKQDSKTKAVIGKLEVETPVEVLFEGADISKYFNKPSTRFDLSNVSESFCYLFVGHWLQGEYGEDRKNIGYTVKTFLETFKNKTSPPALILKTSMGNSSVTSQDIITKNINEIKKKVTGRLPNVYLVHGDITDSEMNDLYNHPKVKAMVSLTKGEGFGRPLLEFSLTGKPIMASGWSGQVDFLDGHLTSLIGGTLTPVHPTAVVPNVILPESKWFTPDTVAVGKAYKAIYKHYNKALELSRKQGYINKNNFSLDAMTDHLKVILDTRLPKFQKKVEFKLPELTLPKIKTNE
jgi:hypothetical protein